MRSKYGMVTKLFSAQRYDPRQVLKSLVWCAEPHRKFSRPVQSQTVECVKQNFWDTSETLLQNRVTKGYENCVLRTQVCDFEEAEKIFRESPHTKVTFQILVWDHTFAQTKKVW